MDVVLWMLSTLAVWVLSIVYLVVPLVKHRSVKSATAAARNDLQSDGPVRDVCGTGPVQVHLMPPLPIPRGTPAALATILAATNHYQVLGVDQCASEEAIRRARRSLTLLAHPDKAGNIPGAPQACQRVLEASEVLLDTQKRAEYDDQIENARLLAAKHPEELLGLSQKTVDRIYKATGVDLTTLTSAQSVLMACDSCPQGIHQLPLLPNLTQLKARWCSTCRTRHAVSEGESWVESQRAFRGLSLGQTFRLYTCSQGLIYDATALGTCCGLLEDWARSKMPLNPCINPLSKAPNSSPSPSPMSASSSSAFKKKDKRKRMNGNRKKNK